MNSEFFLGLALGIFLGTNIGIVIAGFFFGSRCPDVDAEEEE